MRLGVFIVLAMLLSGCQRTYDSLTPEEYPQFVHLVTEDGSASTYNRAWSMSPTAYQFLKGDNPFAEYTFLAYTIHGPNWTWIATYGDPTKLVKSTFPDADLIISFGEYYYIGHKRK